MRSISRRGSQRLSRRYAELFQHDSADLGGFLREPLRETCLLLLLSPGAAQAQMPLPAEMRCGQGRLALEKPAEAPARRHRRPGRARRRPPHPHAPAGPAPSPPAGPVLQIRYGRVGQPEKFDEERYSLRVTPMGVSIDAPTSLGVLRALATLEQLPRTDKQRRYLPEVDIQDQPRFAWRGLLIDAARHFMPVAVIKRNLDGMAAVKLNVLHWHLTDDQGFRVESKRVSAPAHRGRRRWATTPRPRCARCWPTRRRGASGWCRSSTCPATPPAGLRPTRAWLPTTRPTRCYRAVAHYQRGHRPHPRNHLHACSTRCLRR